MKIFTWLKGCAALAVALCSMATPAATIRLLQVQPAVIRETLSTRAADAPIANRGVRLSIVAGGLQHALVLVPNLQLGNWAQTLATRATAYEGELPGLTGSWARMTRTSEGWTGLWFDGQRYFAVDSAASLAETNARAAASDHRAPMVFALADAVFEAGTFDGDMATREVTAEALLADPPMLAAVLPTRRLSVALIADPELAAREGGQTDERMLARLNIVDGVFATQIGVRIAAGSTTVMSGLDSPFSGLNASTLLEQLRDYRGATAAQQAAGVSHLLTGRNLDTSTVGIAYLASLCDRRNGASLSEARNSVNFDALIMAHELGHVFGAPHDGETNDDPPGSAACSATPRSFLMAPQLNGSSTLSACSIERMQPVLNVARCLAPVDAADAALGAPLTARLAQDRPTPVEITVRSEGNTTVNAVQLQIDLPVALGITAASAQVAGGSGSCTTNGLQIVCSLGSLPAGTVRTVQLGLLATVIGSARASLRLGAADDGLANNDTASMLLRVEPGSDLALDVAATPGTVLVGGAVSATLTLQNLGPSDVDDAVLAVAIPAGLTLESVTPAGIACTQSAQTVTCTPTALANGATATLALALRGGTVGGAVLAASVQSSRIDPVAANDRDEVLVNVTPQPVPGSDGGGGGGSGRGGGGALGALALVALASWLRRRRHGRGQRPLRLQRETLSK
jgi:hypothetical protein